MPASTTTRNMYISELVSSPFLGCLSLLSDEKGWLVGKNIVLHCAAGICIEAILDIRWIWIIVAAVCFWHQLIFDRSNNLRNHFHQLDLAGSGVYYLHLRWKVTRSTGWCLHIVNLSVYWLREYCHLSGWMAILFWKHLFLWNRRFCLVSLLFSLNHTIQL